MANEAERIASWRPADGGPVMLPRYLYDMAVAAGTIKADDTRWQPIQPIPINGGQHGE